MSECHFTRVIVHEVILSNLTLCPDCHRPGIAAVVTVQRQSNEKTTETLSHLF